MHKRINDVANNIFIFIRKFNLQTRLLVTFLFISMVPLLTTSAIYYHSMNNVVKDNTYQYFQQLLKSTKLNIDNSFNMHIKKINEITTDLEVVNTMSRYKEMDVIERSYAATKIIEKIKYMIISSGNPASIELINDQGYITYTPYRITSNNIDDSLLYKEFSKSTERISWYMKDSVENFDSPYRNEDEVYIIIAVKINDFEKGNLSGWALFTFDENIIDKSIKQTITDNMNEIYISDGRGNIIVLSKDNKSLVKDNILKVINEIDQKVEETGVTGRSEYEFTANLKNSKYYVSYTTLAFTDWKLVSFVDYNNIFDKARKIENYIIIIILASIIIIIPITFIITMSVTKPLSRIISNMAQFENGNFDVVIEEKNNDEVAFLAYAFNNISKRIRYLVKEVYDVKLNQTKAELIALQSQINPHFLYNTLDSISWMAYIAEHEEICTMVNSLSTFFRLGLNKGMEFCTIEQEIKHVESYIKIQEIRYDNGIKFSFCISHELLGYETIKLILQPLVENALYHGIEPNGGKGNIKIDACKDCDIIRIRVIDDGIGIRKASTISTTGIKHNSSYGIKNIDERIKISYGKQYGVVLSENPEGGAIATITIPLRILRRDDENEAVNS